MWKTSQRAGLEWFGAKLDMTIRLTTLLYTNEVGSGKPGPKFAAMDNYFSTTWP